MTLSAYHPGGCAGAVASDKSIAQATAVIALILLLAFTGIHYSFRADIPALRRFWAYPLCALINLLLFLLGLRAWRANIAAAPLAMRGLLFLLLAWGGILIMRSFDPTPTGIRNLFFTHWGAMSFLIPLLALCGLRARFWPLFCKYGAYFLAIGIIYVGLMDFLLMVGRGFGNPFFDRTILFIAPLFFLGGFQLRKKYIYWGALGLLVWLLFEFLVDGRENIVLIGWYFFCSLFEMWRSPVFPIRDKIRFLIGLAVIIPVFSFIGFQNLYSTIATETLEGRVTAFFKEGEATANTRAGAVDDFFRYLTLGEVVFGHGAVATYRTDLPGLYQPYLEGSARQHIEIGHLEHTLMGGIILNVLFNSLALGAVFLGLRRSRNWFTRVLAYIIAGWLLLMLTAAIPIGNPRYFLVWLAIGGCWSTELRSMSSEQFVSIWRQSSGLQAGTRVIEPGLSSPGPTVLLHPSYTMANHRTSDIKHKPSKI